MTAISQYNHYITVPELQDKEYLTQIKEKIFKFWNENIRDLLIEFENYVIDFAFIDKSILYLIELNPFDTKTGASLFDWNYDKEILLK